MVVNNKILFYLLSSITNFVLLFIVIVISGLLIEEYIVSGIFLTRKIGGADFLYLRKVYLFSAFIYPLLIYLVKDYKYHGFLIFFISVLLLIIRQAFYYSTLPNDYYSIYRSFKETFILIFMASISVHFSQKIIGKKLLSERYSERN